jgi:lambda family phage portal protein
MKLPAWLSRFFTRPAAPAKAASGQRMYAGAKSGRLMFSAPTGSANTELYSSLATLRARSRALCRDVVYAKRARTVVVNNVIGQGMGIQAQVMNNRKRLMDEVNDPIEHAWRQWSLADTCHTGGSLHFGDLERAAMGEVFEAGEVLIRLHRAPFGSGRIPLALELIEAERLADDFEIKPPAGARVTLGVEHDDYGRPVAYYIHRLHPSEMRLTPGRQMDEILRVPAADIIHLKITERWPQTRGVPWLHAAITRLNQLGEFEEAAVVAARIGASKVGFFENPEGDLSALADGDENGTPSATVEAGEFTSLPPGYKFSSWDPNYPNEVFDPFTRSILRGIAAGVGVSYESLSRDYSQSNYSSSRLALLDDRDLWRTLQAWWIRAFREPLHAQWLQAAVLSRAVPIDMMAYANDRARFEACKFKARGWSWVDPTKEVAAYKEAELAGYITKTQVIAMTGGGADLEDVIRERRRELDMLDDADLETDTTHPAEPAPATAPAPAPEPDNEDEEDDDPDAGGQPARVYTFKRDQE